MSKPIIGKVLRILNDHTLIISAGREHGVHKGMRFIVYEEADEIVDLETIKNLGKLEVVKGEVEVIHAQEKFSTATSERYYTSVPITEALIAPLYRTILRYRELPINKKDTAPLPETVSMDIKVGDRVKQVE